jgi:hypothetical protein
VAAVTSGSDRLIVRSCSTRAGIAPVTPTSLSSGWLMYFLAKTSARNFCWPMNSVGSKNMYVTAVVHFSRENGPASELKIGTAARTSLKTGSLRSRISTARSTSRRCAASDRQASSSCWTIAVSAVGVVPKIS